MRGSIRLRDGASAAGDLCYARLSRLLDLATGEMNLVLDTPSHGISGARKGGAINATNKETQTIMLNITLIRV